jgi:replicative DNA helicase
MINRISLEAEQAAIGAVIVNSEILDEMLEITSIEDFTSPIHQRILRATLELRERFGTADDTAICMALADGGQEDVIYAVEMAQNTVSSSNYKSYAKIVRERAQFRAIDSAVMEAGQLVSAAKTPQDASDQAQSKISGLDLAKGDCAIQSAAQAAKEMIKNLEARFQSRNSGELGGLATGFKDVDERLDGLRAGALIVVAGRPAMGKSVYGVQVAQSAAINNDKNVLFFSLEMPSCEVVERMAASIGRIPYSMIRDASCFQDYDQNLIAAVGRINRSKLKIIDTPSIHINQIKAYSRKVHRKDPIDLIVVDHISIATGDGHSREREMASITGGLKALAKELKCPVVALCQLNRSVEQKPDRKPEMQHLRDSGSIEQDADIIQFLFREEYYFPDTDNKGILQVNTAKFRGGEGGIDYLHADFAHMSIGNLDNYRPQDVDQTGSFNPKGGFNIGG